ncbi:MAG: ribonuclease [Ilumatobacteraceae bacterium]|jgi:ribonuclease E
MTDDQNEQRPTAASFASAQVSDIANDTSASQPAEPGSADTGSNGAESDDTTGDGTESIGQPAVGTAAQKRRRGSRGGRNRKKPAGVGSVAIDGNGDGEEDDSDDSEEPDDYRDDDQNMDAHDFEADIMAKPTTDQIGEGDPELPKRMTEGRPSIAAAEKSLVRKPQIGDTRPAPPVQAPAAAAVKPAQPRNRGDRQKVDRVKAEPQVQNASTAVADSQTATDAAKKKRRRGVKATKPGVPGLEVDLDADTIERRRGRERNGRPIGRYLMAVQVRPTLTQVAVLEGRNLIEHYVSRPADDVSQIHGNIYIGKVQNVLPGMEAAFVDIGTPKNAVLYRGDVQYDPEDIVEKSGQPRIEQMLRPKQLVLCQVTKNPISAKGARLTQEVSLPGRFVVLIPNSKTYGISKRLPDDVRKRLRNILDRVKPAQHGLIVRTAAENANEHELRADMTRLLDQWNVIETKAKRANSPTLLYREPELAVRVIREEFNAEYRGVIIDDQRLFEDVRDYVAAFNPDLADRIEYYDAAAEGLPLYERQHIHEQLHRALDRKVWLPSGGSLIIEHAEALTVIDVNTGKNVGTSNLEETVYRNNLEAAEEVAKQLRLRDIGGIVVIDFIDMEIKENRRKVVDAFRSALARDKTRTQVFDISDLGLVEMTRKRIGEGLLVNFADQCPNCAGRGVIIDHSLLE